MSKQVGGDNSQNYQAENLSINNNAIVLYSVEELSKKLLSSAFGDLPPQTLEQIKHNQKSYFGYLTEELKKLRNDQQELKRVIDTPDFQYSSRQSAIAASKTPVEDLHSNLASLLVKRIAVDKDDLKRIVYNEAITVIDKLTIDELKILALCFLITRTKHQGVQNLTEFIQLLENEVKPFIDFKNTNTQFEHLEYVGVATNSVLTRDIVNIFKENYPAIFPIPTDIEAVLNGYDVGKNLLATWRNSKIKELTLTSVGIAVAISYIEKITNQSFDVDVWIN